jgi:hypothetical protein
MKRRQQEWQCWSGREPWIWTAEMIYYFANSTGRTMKLMHIPSDIDSPFTFQTDNSSKFYNRLLKNAFTINNIGLVGIDKLNPENPAVGCARRVRCQTQPTMSIVIAADPVPSPAQIFNYATCPIQSFMPLNSRDFTPGCSNISTDSRKRCWLQFSLPLNANWRSLVHSINLWL